MAGSSQRTVRPWCIHLVAAQTDSYPRSSAQCSGRGQVSSCLWGQSGAEEVSLRKGGGGGANLCRLALGFGYNDHAVQGWCRGWLSLVGMGSVVKGPGVSLPPELEESKAVCRQHPETLTSLLLSLPRSRCCCSQFSISRMKSLSNGSRQTVQRGQG